jgi:hypothetical protein
VYFEIVGYDKVFIFIRKEKIFYFSGYTQPIFHPFMLLCFGAGGETLNEKITCMTNWILMGKVQIVKSTMTLVA